MSSAVLFPGQGSQRRGMGHGLFEAFSEHLRAADAILGYSIQALCESDSHDRLDQTEYTQPALYVVNALNFLQRKRDGAPAPDFLAGHSLGEYSALFAADCFDFETGLRLVKRRAELMARVTGGTMAAVSGLTASQLREVFDAVGITEVDITNTNTPRQIVIAGPLGYLERLEDPLRDRGGLLALLNVSGPFHSRYMRDAQREFENFLADFELRAPSIPVIANVSARPYSRQASDVKRNLIEQLTQPVRWLESMEYLLEQPNPRFEVLGPARQLTKMLEEITALRSNGVHQIDHGADASESAETIVDILHRRAHEHPDAVAFRYLPTGEVDGPEEVWSYAELDRRSRVIAAQLVAEGVEPGDRVLLLYPPGIDFIGAFFGCLYGGFVAVPTHPPDPTRAASTLPRLHAIVRDAEPKLTLSVGWIAQLIADGHVGAELSSLPARGTDAIDPDANPPWNRPAFTTRELAFIQYTSGSTSMPKGVMVSHSNLLHNVAGIEALTHGAKHLASWLPASHDMGLIGGLIYPVFVGGSETIISPLHFLQRPIRWLKVISRYKVELAAGPNFAYDLCVDKSTEADRVGLDISSWRCALNGAESVRPSTLDRFCEAFAAAGFKRSSLAPCYGLAEGTLMITSVAADEEAPMLAIDGTALERNVVAIAKTPQSAYPIVSSGTYAAGTDLVIADPETRKRRAPGEVGEIWVQSGSVAQGYWRKAELTQQQFQAHLTSGEGPYLRTGDLGFVHDKNLYVTGRHKDLLIVRGRNVYPQDIEGTVERSARDLRRGCTIAFSVTIGTEERLVVVSEVKSELGMDLAAARAAIRNGVLAEHEISPHAVVLIKPRSIPKTTSGKLQRRICRDLYLSGGLEVVSALQPLAAAPETPATTTTTTVAPPATNTILPPPPAASYRPRDSQQIVDWLVQQVAVARKCPASEIDPRTPFRSLGLESRDLVSLSGELEHWLGRRLAPTLAYEYPDITSLAMYLAGAGRAVTERPKARVTSSEPIAVVGIGCKFPRAAGPEAFWSLLQNGIDAVREVPADRWDIDALYDADPDVFGRMYTRHGGFIDDVDKFDASFFGISPREAEEMDPQHRLLLEIAWEALEDAAIAPDRLVGSSTGVFMGISSNDYAQRRLLARDLTQVGAYSGTGVAFSTAVGRISYVLGLRGPCLAIDTACSSSLVAVHNAAQALRAGECDLALAGGVNLMLAPQPSVYLCRIGALTRTGRCRTFDSAADGYVRGEGCGVVVLKRLSDAERDGDNILAVVRGSAVNQDGRSNGLTAPNGDAQRQLLEQALANAELSPADVGYVEAHGTGTPIGDPIEAGAIDEAFGREREDKLLVGSVKTNIGHLEAAAGIAGLIKVVLSLRERQIPAHLHLESPSVHIDWERTRLSVPKTTTPWHSARRVAGVSAFGFGGTNAHVLLEEYVPQPKAAVATGPALIVLSAHNRTQLRALVERHLTFIAQRRKRAPAGAGHLHALAYTLQVGRAALPERLAIVAQDLDALVVKLEEFLSGELAVGCYTGSARDKNRGFELLHQEPSAAQAFLRELVDTGRLDRVAELWVHGVSVDWSRMYREHRPSSVRAPTYPFARERHWIDAEQLTSAPASAAVERASRIESLKSLPTPELVVRLIHRLTKTALEQIALDARLSDVGVDSLIAMQLLVEIERVSGVRVHVSDLRKRPTLSDLARLIDTRKARGATARDRYPELEVMQEGGELTPVFWFHGGFGTVQPYVPLVRAIGGAGQLPFYAIQARGIRTDDAPITDLIEMGRYYAEIIQHVQPSGDAQIGGYSHGGRVAYEVARQLQLSGRRVKNIVMIDSAYPLKIRMTERTRYIISLFNFLKTANVHVSREEMSELLAAADLVGALASYGVRAGLRYTEAELTSMLRRMATVLGANLAACNKYTDDLQDLPDPHTPSAHYFLRGRQDVSYGPFLGDIIPQEGEIAYGLRELNKLFDRDEVALWRQKLPQIQAQRTPSEDHMTMFDDAETIRTIATTLRKIYGVEERERARAAQLAEVR